MSSSLTPAQPESRSPWRSPRHRSMRWWSVANFVSNAGTWMQFTVQNLLALQITGSAATGLSMSVRAAPALLMSVLGGAAADRWPRKPTAAVSQALLAVIAFATATLVALDRLDMTSLMVPAAVTGMVATVDNQRGDVLRAAGAEVVHARDGGARVEQGGAQTGADESRATGDDGVLPLPGYDGAHAAQPESAPITGTAAYCVPVDNAA